MNMKKTFNRVLFLNLILLVQFSHAQNTSDKITSTSPNTITTITNVKPENSVYPIFDLNKCNKPEYPRAALRWEYQGSTILKLTTSEDGKVEKLDLIKSSGWRILDQAIALSLFNCRIVEPQDRKLSQIVSYDWTIAGMNDKPAEILENSCPPTRFVRLAASTDKGRGIVAGVYVTPDGKPQRVALEWGSGRKEFDDESIEYLKSCKYKPASNTEKNVDGSISFRFFPISG